MRMPCNKLLKKYGMAALSAAALCMTNGLATAQDYPSKPVTIIVGFSPGGGVDITSRVLAQKMSESFGTVVVENRPGARSNIGSQLVAQAKPDGYTITMVTTTFAINVATDDKVSFGLDDFQAISQVARNPNLILVNPNVPVANLQELIEYGKNNPGKINYAYTGSTQALFGREFAKAAGIEVTHIPYKGAGAAITALLSGEVDMYFGSTSSSGQYVKSGGAKALALASEERSSALPDVPTTAEAGLPEFIAATWYGLLGPDGMPKDVVDTLYKAVASALKTPEVREQLDSRGAQPVGTPPEKFDAFLKSEVKKFKNSM